MPVKVVEFCNNATGVQGYHRMLRILEDRWHKPRYEFEVEKYLDNPGGTTIKKHRITYWKKGKKDA